MVNRYVNTLSTAGGDGTTNATSGASRAFAALREAIDSLGTSLSDATTIWCEGSVADTSDVYQTPWDMTTTATNYLEIIGEQSKLHPNFSLAKSGKYDTTLYRLERTNSHVLYNNLPAHVIWRGLQAKCTANDAGNYNCFRMTNANQVGTGGFFEVSECIAVGVVSGGSTVYGFQPGVQGAGGICKTWNCIAIDCSQGFVGAGTGHEFWNCTAADCVTSGFTEDEACVLKNCLSKGASVGFIGTFTGSSNNAEDDGNGAPGANSRTAQTFTFVDAANNNFHLASTDTGAKGFGVSDPGSGAFSDDVDGQTRGATWDIGFDQYVPPSIEQEGFRWGVDDGSESAHTWEAAQDTSITIPDTQSRLLRVLVNAAGSDPAAAAYTLRAQKNGSGGYAAVGVGATGYTPISYVGGQASGRAGSTSTTAVTFAFTGGSASVPAEGDLVVIALSTGSTVDRDLAISGYTEITDTDIYADNTYDTNLALFYKFMGATPDTTVTIPSTGSNADAQRWDIRCFRNVDATTPIDVSAVIATGINSRLANPGSITPTTPGAVVYVVGAGAGATGGTYTDSNSLTDWRAGNSVDTQDAMMGAGYYTGWTSGAYDPAAFTGGGTDTTNDSWAAVCVALRPVTFANEVYITTSANITAGGEATTARLTAPSGKSTSDFVTGRRWDDENGTDTIDITTDDYTEVEWAVALSSAPADTDYFEFRVYAGAAALSTYTLTPKWTVGSGGTVVAIGQAVETDLAQPLTKRKAKALGQVVETDLAQPLTRVKAKALGQAIETDLAQPLTKRKAKALSQATETDLAQAPTKLKRKALGQATEIDLAQALAKRKAKTLGQASEADLAQPLTRVKAKALGQAMETDLAQALTKRKAKTLGQAVETDLAQPITKTGSKIIPLGQVVETDLAQPLTKRKVKALGQATEADLAQAVTRVKARVLGQSVETDLAQALTKRKAKTLGQAVETDLAQPITKTGSKIIPLGQAVETDLVQPLTRAKVRALGIPIETDLAQALARSKVRVLGQAVETDLAQALTVSGGVVIRYIRVSRVGGAMPTLSEMVGRESGLIMMSGR